MTVPRLQLPITQVTVFPSQARVTRTGPLPAEPTTRLVITDLPLSLLESSVQVRLEGLTGEVREVCFGWDLSLPEEASRSALENRVREALAAVEACRLKVTTLEAQVAWWKGLTAFGFDSNKVAFAGEDSVFVPESGVEPFLYTLEQVTTQLERLQKELREARQGLEDATKAHKVAEDAWNRASSANTHGQVSRTVEVAFAAPLEGEGARLVVSYLVPGATWIPTYEVRYEEETLQAELAVRALVAQHSGEDWQGVSLSLSTADGLTVTELPKLASLRISRAQPPVPRSGWRPAPEGLEALFDGFDRDRPNAWGDPSLPKRLTWPSRAQLEKQLENLAPPKPRPSAPPPPPAPKAAKRSYESAPTTVADVDQFVEFSRQAPSPAVPGNVPMPPPMVQPSLAMPAAPPPPGMVPQGFGGAPPMAKTMAAAPAPRRAGGAFRSREESPSYDMMSADLEGLAVGPGGGGSVEAVRIQALEVSATWLSFDMLRLRGPEDPQRGTLQMQDVQLSVLEQFPVPQRAKEVLRALDLERQRRSAASMPDLPNLARPVHESRGNYDHRYDCATKVDIPSDRRWHGVTVVRGRGTAQLEYRCVPRAEQAVYRELVLANPLPAPLLTGPAELYLGAELAAASQLETVAAGGMLRLGLGVEDRLKVARNTHYKETAAGLLTRMGLEHEITVNLTSQLDRAVKVEVLERIPVTDDTELEVKDTTSDKRLVPYDQAERGRRVRGGRRWLVTLDPRGKAQLTLGYRIALSPKLEVSGGNRRD